MISGVRTGLRVIGLLLIGLVAWFTGVPGGHAGGVRLLSSYQVSASAAAQADAAATVRLGTKRTELRNAAVEIVRSELASPDSSVVRHLTRRVFVEDTPPSSSAVLESAELELPVIQDVTQRDAPRLPAKSGVPESNRQRAP